MSEEEKKAIQTLKDWLCKTHSEFCKVGAIGIPNKEFFATETVLNLIDKQNKVIDEESEQLAGLTIWNNNKEEPLILVNKEEVKKYYFRKVEEDE